MICKKFIKRTKDATMTGIMRITWTRSSAVFNIGWLVHNFSSTRYTLDYGVRIPNLLPEESSFNTAYTEMNK